MLHSMSCNVRVKRLNQLALGNSRMWQQTPFAQACTYCWESMLSYIV